MGNVCMPLQQLQAYQFLPAGACFLVRILSAGTLVISAAFFAFKRASLHSIFIDMPMCNIAAGDSHTAHDRAYSASSLPPARNSYALELL